MLRVLETEVQFVSYTTMLMLVIVLGLYFSVQKQVI